MRHLISYAKMVLIAAGCAVVLGFFLMMLTFVDVNAINTTLAGEAPPSTAQFLAHPRVKTATFLFGVGAVGASVALMLFVGAVATHMAEGSYLWRLRREARNSFGDNKPAPLIVALKMLEIEHKRDGWQIETIAAYLDAAKADKRAIDADFLSELATYCKGAHADADEILKDGEADPRIDFAGRNVGAADLVTNAENAVDRIRDLRHRDSRPVY